MDDKAALIREVCRHCDLTERLALLPPSARARGLYCRSVEAALAGSRRLERYRAVFPEKFSSVRWYPLGEVLTRITVAGALLTEPSRVHEGMFEIGRHNPIAFAESLIGRALLRLLSRDPRKLLQQALIGHRQSSEPGRWTLSFPEERTAIMTMTDEYSYIESYLLGAAQGTFDAIELPVRTEVKLTSRFNGQHVLRW